MAGTIRIAPLNTKGIENQSCMHLLPCKVANSGDANVKEYFESSVRVSDEVLFGKGEVKMASFRGRPLKGRSIEVPLNFEGVVLKEERKPYSDEEERCLVPKAKFESFSYWNLDNQPIDNDAIYKSFQWLEIANVLHGNTNKTEREESIEPTQTDR